MMKCKSFVGCALWRNREGPKGKNLCTITSQCCVAAFNRFNVTKVKKKYSDKNEMKKWNVWQELIKKRAACISQYYQK
jgi:hypothetical protein